MKEGGFEPRSAKDSFIKKGYVVVTADGHLPKVRFGDSTKCGYVFRRELVPQIYKIAENLEEEGACDDEIISNL